MFKRLAFVDLETTGLSPLEDRIAEIGVITVDEHRVDRWATLIRTSARHASQDQSRDDAPRFADVATDLASRLAGRLVIAHNARFDFSFLRAEFERAGLEFNADVLCSLMLSRTLYPKLERHDLDSLSRHHGLSVETRHRALPDADLVWQWWQAIHRQFPRDTIAGAIEALLAGPVLPAQLDPSLIARLPHAPGAYVLHGEGDQPLAVGAASNLRRHIVNYFRIDNATTKAIEVAHRVSNITWRATRGILGARLRAAELDATLFGNAERRANAPRFTWQLSPQAAPCMTVVPLSAAAQGRMETFGLFATERKAHNALVRLAARRRLCHCLVGVLDGANVACSACQIDREVVRCAGLLERKRELTRLFIALRPLRVSIWPHPGPIGIRERSDLHIVDRWQFLGTARAECDIQELLERRPYEFDPRMYGLLRRCLSRLPAHCIVDLASRAVRSERVGEESSFFAA